MYQPDTDIEKHEILKRYRNLLHLWKPRNPEDKKSVKKAFKMALEAHKDMRRKSGEPYIYHPLSVATIAAGEIGLGATSIICALLHDVVEDTEYTIEDIRGLFGEKVAGIIDGLTKIKGIFDQRTDSIHAENFKKILLTLSDDVRVILIKLADRLHNMRTLDALAPEKQLKISSETMYLYAPLAHRLGLHAIKSELEDLALKYTEPQVYESILRKLKESAKGRSRFVNKFIYPIKKDLAGKGFKFSIFAREKSIAAIWQKMQKKEVPFDEIYDIFAIRIVIDSPTETEKTDCWKVYSAITDHYRPNMDRLRDWISIPKANGYEALHTTVMSHTGQWVEIQIRSRRMDEIAEKGYAAHWKYKESMNLNSQLDNWLDRIKEMIESPDADALSFIDDVKGYFFLDEISVFTPQGELRTLPANSTVLDFAYAIHTELGHTCIGAKVDKKLTPINQVLKNGQQVELITSRKQSPREEWLNYVVTTRAKSNIKLAVRHEKKKFSKQGKDKLGKWFLQFDIDFTQENIRKFLAANNFSSLIDLYFAAAQDKIGLKDVKIFAASSFRNGWVNYVSKNKSRRKTDLPTGLKPSKAEILQGGTGQHVDGTNGQFDYEVANCCNPIPGDDVIGLKVSETLPVRIHRTKCPKAQEQISMFGNRMIKLNWINHASISYLTDIKVTGLDRQGLINEITRIISNELSLNIKSFYIEAHDGLTEGSITLYVQDTSILNDALAKLKNVDGIIHVTRID
ncbi:MAG: RelA/SpoT family protein [Bacteroidales bacterium]|jgi:GTP pyrophosphokinase|nr:RelA/SpoT family protein [Bacteroidales bacterium]